MTVVTDPSNLDRFKVIVAPVEEIISLRGLGAARQAVQTNGQSDGTTTFTRAAGDFGADGVVAGDVLCVLDDPADDQGIIGHYRVVSQDTATTITVDRAVANHTGTDLTWRCFAAATTGGASEELADGVTLQALYSFLKEEWKTLAAGIGNAEDLIQYDFPLIPLTSESMILGGVNGAATSAWSFAADSGVQSTDTEGQSRELIRTGGWQERNTSDNVLRRYAGVVTLGTLDTDAQVYFQTGDATGAPTDFKLTGAVNQAVLVSGPDVGPDGGTGFAVTTSNTITRNDGGNWATDGYRVGDYVIIRGSENTGENDGNFGPLTSVDNSVDGDIVFSGTPLTNNAADTTMICQVDHRRYLELRVRKKAKSYAQAGLSEIGVTTLVALVNRFPLAHAADAAITLQDGVMAGDGTTTGEIFQETESHTTGSDGVTETAPTADSTAFTLSSAGSTFNSQVRSLVTLRAGDSVVISTGSDAGSYVIKSVDDANTLTLWKDPALTYTGGESTQSFDARTASVDNGHTNATLADVDGSTGTLTSATSTFGTDNGLGDRAVSVGDMVEVTAGTAGVLGVYKVVSQDSATQLTLNTSDQIFSGETSQSYRVLRPGMHLQRFETLISDIGDDPTFNDADPDTLTRSAGSFITDGFVIGSEVITTGATLSANDGNRIVATVAALTLTLIAEETLTTNGPDSAVTTTGDYGVVRAVNSISYPFHWRLFANAGSLAQIFQFLQWKLRLTSDIDEATAANRGDVTDLLMTFASPTGTTLDLFPDDLSATELNNVTYQDQTGDSRNNAFLVGLTLQVNTNLINSATARLVVFFTDADGTPSNGDEFGSNGAIIVDDNLGADMDFTTITANISTTYDYTNNAQGGRTPNTDAAVTVVALGDDLAQHVLVTDTITKVNAKTIAVLPALERNYSNPA